MSDPSSLQIEYEPGKPITVKLHGLEKPAVITITTASGDVVRFSLAADRTFSVTPAGLPPLIDVNIDGISEQLDVGAAKH